MGFNPEITRDVFISEYGAAMQQNVAAVFVGAGLSRPAGYVDWKGLLRPLAQRIGLDVDSEPDLVSVAQYCLNADGDRSGINQRLTDEISSIVAAPTGTHKVLARLPVDLFWTTNYDAVLERALRDTGRRTAVKSNVASLRVTHKDADVLVVKMHGQEDNPESMIITRDDYDRYARTNGPMLTALKAELTSRTFLFLGFSFTDPNLDHVFSHLSSEADGGAPRPHYAIMRREVLPDYGGNVEKHAYALNRQRHKIRELRRYGVRTLLIDEFKEIPEILGELERRWYHRTVFVSGSYFEAKPWNRDRLDELCIALGNRLIVSGFDVACGFGQGAGGPILKGALDELYAQPRPKLDRRLRLRPFPRTANGRMSAEEKRRHRRTLIAEAGFVVFVAGNRADPDSGIAVESPGVQEEYELTRELGRHPIPIGATGWTARTIWNDVSTKFDALFPKGTPRHLFDKLNDDNATNEELLDAVFGLIKHLRG